MQLFYENMFIELMFGKLFVNFVSITNLEGNNVWITYLDENWFPEIKRLGLI